MDLLKRQLKGNKRDGRPVARYVFILTEGITQARNDGYSLLDIYRTIKDSTMNFKTFCSAVDRKIAKPTLTQGSTSQSYQPIGITSTLNSANEVDLFRKSMEKEL